jgi:hypothetical protein
MAKREKGRVARITKLILPFYICWVIPTIILLHFPVPENITSFQLNLVVFSFVGFYLVLASSLSHKVIIKVFDEENKVLYSIICFSVGLFLVIFIYVRFFGNSSKIVSSVSTANLLFAATIVGAGLSSAVKRVAELVPICVTAAIADMMSVLQGPTKEMIESISTYYQEGMTGTPPLVDFIVIKFGIPGFEVPMPLFGVTDWVLVVLVSSAMIRLQKNDNLFGNFEHPGNVLYFPVAAAALFVGLVVAQITNSFIPAMVFIAIFFLLFLLIKLKVYKEMRKTDVAYSFVFPAIVVFSLLLFSS